MTLAQLTEARERIIARQGEGLFFVSKPLFELLSGNREALRKAKDKARSEPTLKKNRRLVYQPTRFKAFSYPVVLPRIDFEPHQEKILGASE